MYSDIIRLVQGDTRPFVILTLTDELTGNAINLSSGSTTVSVLFRLAGTKTTLSTISCSKVTDGSDGKVQFDFAGGVLDVDPGAYEGEIRISFNGAIQTVYDVIRFRVREKTE